MDTRDLARLVKRTPNDEAATTAPSRHCAGMAAARRPQVAPHRPTAQRRSDKRCPDASCTFRLGRHSSEVSQQRKDVGAELSQKPLLIVAGTVEDEVVEARVDIRPDLRDGLFGVGGNDPTLGDLFDG